MSAAIATYNPHAFWCKLKRRYGYLFHPWMAFVSAALGLAFLAPAACMLGWIYRGQGYAWLYTTGRWVWFLACCIASLLAGWFLILSHNKETQRQKAREVAINSIHYVLTAVFLLLGKIDWAVIAFYGISAIAQVYNLMKEKSWRHLLIIISNSVILAAFLFGWVWLLVGILILLPMIHQAVKLGFWKVVAQKRSRSEYVQWEREKCETGHG